MKTEATTDREPVCSLMGLGEADCRIGQAHMGSLRSLFASSSSSPACWVTESHPRIFPLSNAAGMRRADTPWAARNEKNSNKQEITEMDDTRCYRMSPPGTGAMVPGRGLEPPRCYPLVPETSASTNSATWARWAGLSRPPREGGTLPTTLSRVNVTVPNEHA